jgi:lysozyme
LTPIHGSFKVHGDQPHQQTRESALPPLFRTSGATMWEPNAVAAVPRRAVVAGLAALALAGCGTRPPGRLPATAGVVDDPASVGFDGVIDISHSNRVRDFAAAVEIGGVRAVIHKATEGVGWADPLYGERRQAAEAVGLLWGAYHFGTCQHRGADQAQAFLAASRPGPDTLLALDLELNERDPGNSMDIGHAEDFVATVLAATGRLPLVYVQPAWADGEPAGGSRRTLGGAIGSGSILAECDLWLADYRVRPELPAAWDRRGWRLWQYAGDRDRGPFGRPAGAVAGIDRCDRSVFAGTAESLPAFWNRS